MNDRSLPRSLILLALATPWMAPVARAGDQPAPEWFERVSEGRASRPDDAHQVFVKGRRSYSEERAHGDARLRVEDAVDQWLAPDAPADWQAPPQLVESLIAERHVQALPVDAEALGLDEGLPAPEVLYVAGYRLDLSPARRADLMAAYHREIGDRNMTLAGGGLGLVVAVLAIVVGYIRADEATRGYYTTRLRLIAGAAAGAAAVAAYRLLA